MESKNTNIEETAIFLNGKSTIEYKCFSSLSDDWDADKATVIITIHNESELLDYTCKNLSKYKKNIGRPIVCRFSK